MTAQARLANVWIVVLEVLVFPSDQGMRISRRLESTINSGCYAMREKIWNGFRIKRLRTLFKSDSPFGRVWLASAKREMRLPLPHPCSPYRSRPVGSSIWWTARAEREKWRRKSITRFQVVSRPIGGGFDIIFLLFDGFDDSGRTWLPIIWIFVLEVIL